MHRDLILTLWSNLIKSSPVSSPQSRAWNHLTTKYRVYLHTCRYTPTPYGYLLSDRQLVSIHFSCLPMQTQKPKDGDKVPRFPAGRLVSATPPCFSPLPPGWVRDILLVSPSFLFLAFWLARAVTYLVHRVGSALYPVKKL